MTAAFTGTQRGMTPAQSARIEILLRFLGVTRVLHGACEGSDREFHDLTKGILRELYPGTPEQAEWASAHVAPGDRVWPVPNDAKPQISRDHRMVDRAPILIAAPRGRHEVLRSGTWATVRYAMGRLKAKPPHAVTVYLVFPNGDVQEHRYALAV